MDETVALDQLVGIVQERDDVYNEYTAAIFDMLQPTVLAALRDILEAKETQIEWSEVFIVPENLTVRIVCAVTYESTDTIPAFVAAIASTEPASASGDTRMIRIGLPIAHCLQPKDELVAFFRQLIADGEKTDTGYTAPDTTAAPVTVQFDLTNLSKDQVVQFLAFQHLTADGKH